MILFIFLILQWHNYAGPVPVLKCKLASGSNAGQSRWSRSSKTLPATDPVADMSEKGCDHISEDGKAHSIWGEIWTRFVNPCQISLLIYSKTVDLTKIDT